jgi:small subunit ribosomal protein S21
MKYSKTLPPVTKNYPSEIEEGHLQPLQVQVGHNFERAMKAFRSLVQAENVINDWRKRQAYEKPSEKKRRKKAETMQRLYEEEMKAKKMASGEYEREKIKKQQKKEQRMKERMERELQGAEE